MNLLEEINNIVLAEVNPYDNILTQNLTGIGTMINVGRDRTAIEKANLVQYSAILDKKVCPLCEHLDGNVTKVGSPEYFHYMPRVHHNCRCIYVYISRDESRQPDIFFPKVPEDMEKLGSLISETISTGGAVATMTSVQGIIATGSKYNNIDNLEDRLNEFEGEDRQLLIDYIAQLPEDDYPIGVIDQWLSKMNQYKFMVKNQDIGEMHDQLHRVYRDYLEEAFMDIDINFVFGSNLDYKLGPDVKDAARQYQIINFMHSHLDAVLPGNNFKKSMITEYKIENLGASTSGQLAHSIYNKEVRKLSISESVFKMDNEPSAATIKNEMNSAWATQIEGENFDLINNKTYTLIHELGHAADLKLNEKYNKELDLITSKKTKYEMWSVKNLNKKDNFTAPSEYGKTKVEERFAESFVDLCLNENPMPSSIEISEALGIDHKDLYIKPEQFSKLINKLEF